MRWWLIAAGVALSLLAGFLVGRTLIAPSDDELMWRAMQQTHQQVRLPDGAALIERQATPPGLWSNICFADSSGCPRDERTYLVESYEVTAKRLRDTLIGLPVADVRQECPSAGLCRITATIEVGDSASFVLEVTAPMREDRTASVIGVHATPNG